MTEFRDHVSRLPSTVAVLLAATFASQLAAAEVRKPNVVYIMSDELAYYELSCMGHPQLKTPNVDRMAAEGIRFTQALAGCSVCAPTRCCLMTGKHGGHTSVRKNDGGTPMRAEEETIASMLNREGYATGGFGKWGCGGRGSTGVPEKHGFDVFVGYYDQVHAHSFYPAYIVRNSEEMVLEGNRGGRSGQTYSHYVIMREAMDFIRRNKGHPFFCYLPITPPHGMYDIPDSDPGWALFKNEPWPEEARRYAAMVSMVDRHVGEVFDLLEELGPGGDGHRFPPSLSPGAAKVGTTTSSQSDSRITTNASSRSSRMTATGMRPSLSAMACCSAARGLGFLPRLASIQNRGMSTSGGVSLAWYWSPRLMGR